jgi:hypothetical protein
LTSRSSLDPQSQAALALEYSLVSARAREGLQVLLFSFILIFIAIFSGIGGVITSHDTSAHANLFRVIWAAYAMAVTACFLHLLWCSALSFALWRKSFLRRTGVQWWGWRSGRVGDVVVLIISVAVGVASQI